MRYSKTAIIEIGKKYGRISSKRLLGHNFMTPYVAGVFTNKGVTFELSEGDGFSGDQIIGVTFFEPNKKHSTCCYSMEEVEELLTKVIKPQKGEQS
jgi:hypothetical protein